MSSHIFQIEAIYTKSLEYMFWVQKIHKNKRKRSKTKPPPVLIVKKREKKTILKLC